MKYLARILLRLMGWKVQGEVPKIDKYIVVSAPHTSNLDFVLGALYFLSRGIKAHFLIKKELFFFPLGPVLKSLGGIPVNRKDSKNVINEMVCHFKSKKRFNLVITPEGTRKKNPHWKKGFYHIALESQVPVVPSYFDYKEKRVAIFEPCWLGDDMEEEIIKIKRYFKDVTPRFPDKFSLGKI